MYLDYSVNKLEDVCFLIRSILLFWIWEFPIFRSPSLSSHTLYSVLYGILTQYLFYDNQPFPLVSPSPKSVLPSIESFFSTVNFSCPCVSQVCVYVYARARVSRTIRYVKCLDENNRDKTSTPFIPCLSYSLNGFRCVEHSLSRPYTWARYIETSVTSSNQTIWRKIVQPILKVSRYHPVPGQVHLSLRLHFRIPSVLFFPTSTQRDLIPEAHRLVTPSRPPPTIILLVYLYSYISTPDLIRPKVTVRFLNLTPRHPTPLGYWNTYLHTVLM